MSYADLTDIQKQQLHEFLRDYRAAFASVVSGLRRQQLLKMAYDATIGDIWALVNNGDVINDESGLGGADLEMTKADFNAVFQLTSAILNGVYSDDGGAVATVWPDRETVDAYGVQLAGPSNVG